MSLRVTSIATGGFGLMLLGLIANIVALRNSEKISIGSGNNKLLELRIRGHANFIETVPFAVLLLGLSEYTNALSSNVVAIMAGTLFAGRLSHAYAFTFNHNMNTHLRFRFPGMVATLSVIGLTSVNLIYANVTNKF